MMKDADLNNDGTISLEECFVMVQKWKVGLVHKMINNGFLWFLLNFVNLPLLLLFLFYHVPRMMHCTKRKEQQSSGWAWVIKSQPKRR
jgi:hypothetical protein